MSRSQTLSRPAIGSAYCPLLRYVLVALLLPMNFWLHAQCTLIQSQSNRLFDGWRGSGQTFVAPCSGPVDQVVKPQGPVPDRIEIRLGSPTGTLLYSQLNPVMVGGVHTLTSPVNVVGGTTYAVLFFRASFNNGDGWLEQDVIPGNLFAFNGTTWTSYPGFELQVSVLINPRISTSGPAGTSFCAGTGFALPFTVVGPVTPGNTFTAQLSNAAGSFTSPVAIGSVAGTTSGSIACTIPPGTPPGTGYRVRVVGSTPAVNGTSNGTDLTITAPPTWYADVDSDGLGNGADFQGSCTQPVGYVSDSSDPCPLAVAGIANFNEATCTCEAGYYPQVTQNGPSTIILGCAPCPVGSYCPDGVQALLCPAGYYNDQEGQVECTACAPGSYVGSPGAVACSLCPADTYNPVEAATECLPCADGNSSAEGATECTPDFVCTTDLVIEFQTDGAPFETTWEIRTEDGQTVVAAGGPLVAPFGVQTEFTCVADGCYTFAVLDAAGDGMSTGGYILRTLNDGLRIIDNRNNFSSGSVSALSGGQGFCVPMSTRGPLFTSCDKLDWVNGQYVVTAPDPAVSAEWIVGGSNAVQDNNSGYEFWIFDPNGSYSFRRFRSHHVSDGFGPASATRACHMRLNNWAVASQVPANVLMNVRVRSRVNGENGPFGPACRLMIDPVRAACPLSKLMDIPGNQFFSCGVFRPWGTGNYLHARPVTGANRYQFRFRIAAEGFEVVRTATTYFVQLNWPATSAPQLEEGKTYDVDVRVSRDGGITWCTAGPSWGEVCQVTIGVPPVNANSLMVDDHQGAQFAGELRVFPNPNRGDVLTVHLEGVADGVDRGVMELYDLGGKRVGSHQLPVAAGTLNSTVDLGGSLAPGMYVVHLVAGEARHTIRLMVQ